MSGSVAIHDLEPPAGPRYEGGLSFARTVQPVLDRHCIGCHGLDKTESDVDLLGTLKDVTFPYPVHLWHMLGAARPRTAEEMKVRTIIECGSHVGRRHWSPAN